MNDSVNCSSVLGCVIFLEHCSVLCSGFSSERHELSAMVVFRKFVKLLGRLR